MIGGGRFMPEQRQHYYFEEREQQQETNTKWVDDMINSIFDQKEGSDSLLVENMLDNSGSMQILKICGIIILAILGGKNDSLSRKCKSFQLVSAA